MCNVYVCVARLVCRCITSMQFPQSPEEGIKYPRGGVTGSLDPCDVDAEN